MTHYFLGTRLLGASPAPHWWSDTQVESANLVYVCPACGDAWARILSSPYAEWSPIRAGCPLHEWVGGEAGSFLHPWLHTLEGLPPEVLLHEFTLRLKDLHA